MVTRVVRYRHIKLPNSIKGPRRVKVGFPTGSTNVDKAIWNEFGTSRGIPERPFMRNSMRNNLSKYMNALKSSATSIMNGRSTTRQNLMKLGVLAASDIQDEIKSLKSPPNAPSTIKAKGSSNPLIDTGEMRQSVTWKIDE